MKIALLIFVKLPIAGMVKTRLAKDIGSKQAALFYAAFVEDLLARVDKSEIETLIFYDPEEPASAYNNWIGNRRLIPQRGKDLGKRMLNAFKDAFTLGYKKCVLTGSDLPDLPTSTIKKGLSSLDKYPACLGPAKDGGYYLIGFQAKTLTDIPLTNIRWSTPHVFEETVQKFESLKLKPYILPEHADVDTLEDLMALLQNKDIEKVSQNTLKTYQDYLKTT
ncbi:TIGR04282 family arsenosugar biosynthesis glycosyltransferase [Desulfovibrio sp. UCD-KL4C]|uniref:TIGR04282 family arsenosugar biosynthesis glycosyltransferase n=1 Tax=Desulfovibrio sp. UCD-KL4C TaxID=2578120 RepID=UPI0025BC9667|nr:TIGR04282 family arsenosugar biosynthesis glycosyltransferase [Desulfovibrio sp. UCD-KL4C]